MRHFQHDAVILPPQRRTSLSPGEQRQILIVEMLADEQAPCRALSQLPTRIGPNALVKSSGQTVVIA